ncbi:MAG: hypothetical protein FWH53_03635 [Leptospirales bacterium]|nr:hypothetical protein [Leptospirales bacterium]
MAKRIILWLLFICLASVEVLPAGKDGNEKLQVTGRVRLVGSDVRPELVISAEGGLQWYIANEDKQKLMNLQQRIVTVEGKETIKEMKFANGRSAGKRHILSDIKVITVK